MQQGCIQVVLAHRVAVVLQQQLKDLEVAALCRTLQWIAAPASEIKFYWRSNFYSLFTHE